jgi:hypothetical protein
VHLCTSNDQEKWKKAIIWVFDSPKMAEKPFEERIKHLKTLTFPSFVKIVETIECKGISKF